ncbi:hypothetical protein [uncultured Desulfobacter sp.]|uniref:hypothetical protein n=1 Tax=uncultured Desulfobacter sp. TaxID=240139 RepID=UPI00374A5BCD
MLAADIKNFDVKETKNTVIDLFRNQKDDADISINDFLEKELGTLDLDQRMDLLEELISQFAPHRQPGITPVQEHMASESERHALERVIRLLLGRELTTSDFHSDQLLESLADAINTVFESLNLLISAVNTTLAGKQDSDETIRQVIGYHLEGSEQAQPLEAYIGQIGKAFSGSHEASKKAALTMVSKIMSELSPEKIEKDAGVSIFTPMRKNKCFDVYRLKFNKIQKWFESGRFMESYLREFEKNCQNISFNK